MTFTVYGMKTVLQVRPRWAHTLTWPLLSELWFCSDLFGKMQLVRMERAGRSNIVLCSVWYKLLSCKWILSGIISSRIAAAVVVVCSDLRSTNSDPGLKGRCSGEQQLALCFVTVFRRTPWDRITNLLVPFLIFSSLVDSEVCRIFCKLVCNKKKS